jgi:flagellar hook-basal body complex protein FliE
MSIAPIGPVGPVSAVTPISTTTPSTSSNTSSGADFGKALENGLNQVGGLQDNADNLATQAATGTLADPASYMVASTEASLATELTVAVRNKAVDAFNEIMRMQA